MCFLVARFSHLSMFKYPKLEGWLGPSGAYLRGIHSFSLAWHWWVWASGMSKDCTVSVRYLVNNESVDIFLLLQSKDQFHDWNVKRLGSLGEKHMCNVGIAIINHPFLMVWWLGGWFIIAIPTSEPFNIVCILVQLGVLEQSNLYREVCYLDALGFQ